MYIAYIYIYTAHICKEQSGQPYLDVNRRLRPSQADEVTKFLHMLGTSVADRICFSCQGPLQEQNGLATMTLKFVIGKDRTQVFCRSGMVTGRTTMNYRLLPRRSGDQWFELLTCSE